MTTDQQTRKAVAQTHADESSEQAKTTVSPASERRSEQLIDKAVADTFPASDPTAVGASIAAADKEADRPKQKLSSQPPGADPFPWPKSPAKLEAAAQRRNAAAVG